MKIPPIFSFDARAITKSELEEFLPKYVFEETNIHAGMYKKRVYGFFVKIIRIIARIVLRSIVGYKTIVAPLSQEEVDHVYSREAKTYEWKHHLTTNFHDTWWRRAIAFDITSYVLQHSLHKKKITLVDLGTGVGLSLLEMFRVFHRCGIMLSAFGVDFNKTMLKEATELTIPRMQQEGLLDEMKELKFVRGDGRNLTGFRKPKHTDFFYFEKGSVDCVTIMCGIGGIDLPYESFEEQLVVLKEGGVVTMLDIHAPLLFLSNHWPWFIRFIDHKLLEYLVWRDVTMPLALRAIWGWQNPTPIFYKAPLTVWYDTEHNSYYGFEKISFSYESESWFFGLPFVNTAKIILKKIFITEEEYKRRRRISHALVPSV